MPSIRNILQWILASNAKWPFLILSVYTYYATKNKKQPMIYVHKSMFVLNIKVYIDLLGMFLSFAIIKWMLCNLGKMVYRPKANVA